MSDACGEVFSEGNTMDWMWLVPQNLFVGSLTLNVLFWGRDGPFKRWSLVGYFDYWKASWGSSIIRFLCNVVAACCGLCFCCYDTVVMKFSLALRSHALRPWASGNKNYTHFQFSKDLGCLRFHHGEQNGARRRWKGVGLLAATLHQQSAQPLEESKKAARENV